MFKNLRRKLTNPKKNVLNDDKVRNRKGFFLEK